MYAPRQHRSEKKKPFSNFLALEQTEHEGPIMAPPVYSVTGETKQADEQEAKETKDSKAPEQSATEQNAVQNKRQQESESSETSSETAEPTTQAVQKKAVGRHENPPQFKLKAGAPFQFKFAAAPIQMKAGNSSGGGAGSVPGEVMSKMEGAFGTSFDDVKITANSSKAKDAGALAYAQGSEIHFAPGQFNPESKGGQELLGHELAHVVQQREGRVQANANVGGLAVNNDHGLEAEADSLGAKAAQFKADSNAPAQKMSAGGSGSGAVQMKVDPKEDHDPNETKREENQDQKVAKEEEQTETDQVYGELNDRLALDGFTQRPEEKKENNGEGDGESANTDKKSGENNTTAAESDSTPSNKTNDGQEKENEEEEEEKEEGETEEKAQDTADGNAEDEGNEDEDDPAQDAAEKKEKDDAKKDVKSKKAESDKKSKDKKGGPDVKDKGKGAGKGCRGGKGGKGGGAGGGGGTGVSSGGFTTAVPTAQMGNFGDGKEPELTLVNKAAVKDYDPSMIVTDNGDGTYIVISSSIPTPEAPQTAPVQMAPDPDPNKPVKKKLPASKSKEAMAANRQKAQQMASQFDSEATSKIAALEQTKSSISTNVGAGAESAKQAVLAASAAEKARVEAGIEAEKQNLLAGAERVKSEARAQLQTSLSAIKTAADLARKAVEDEFTKVDGDFVTLEGTQKESFTKSFTDAKKALVDIGEKYAVDVIAFGDEKAGEYAKEPVPSMSGTEEFFKGASYEQDRHDAKVKGAKDAAAGYAKGFRDEAKKQSDALNGGETELHKYVTDSVKASRDAILQRKQAALDEIQTQETGSALRLTEQCNSVCLNIDAGAQQSITSLDEQKTHSLGMIESTAQGKVLAIEEAAQNSVLNLEYQLQGAIDGLYAQKNQAITSVSNQNNPSASGVSRHFAAAMKGIDEAITSTQLNIEEGCVASVAGLDDTATESATELNTAASTAIDSAAQTVNATITGLEGQRDGYVTTAKAIETGTVGSITQTQDGAKKDIQDQYKAVTDDFDKAKLNLDTKMAENARGFDSNILAKFNEAKTEIPNKAQEAKDAVQPRWVRWLLAAIEVLVVILITAIILAAMASGVGILGLLLIGAVAGAVGGALKYGAKCALTSEKFSLGGLAKATLDGAFDGVNIAVGLIPGVGPGVLIGMGALSGAFKYGTDVLFTPGKEFSWGELLGKTLLGGVQGAFGAMLGHYGNQWGGAIAARFGSVTTKILGENVIKKVTAWTVQSLGGWVMGGASAVVDNWLSTGVWDTSKFGEAMTAEALFTNAATTVVGDVGAYKAQQISTARGGIGPNVTKPTPETNTNSNSTENTTTNKENTTSNNENTTSNKENTTSNNENTTSNKENTTSNNENTTSNKENTTSNNENTTSNKENTTNNHENNNTNHENPVNSNETLPPVVENTTPLPKETVNTPETNNPPVKLTGKEQAAAKNYPEAPPGYEWVAGRDGEPYIRRTSGGKQERVQVRFDAESGTFKPTVEAPSGYHWELVNGEFQPVHNANLADSLPPIVYDPQTGGFKDANTGKPFSGDITQVPVRGQDFQGFQDSLHPSDRAKLGGDPTAMAQAYEMYATKDWAGLEALFNAKGIKWPPNRGFISVTDGVLPVGSKFDRFGGRTDEAGNFKDTGTFVAPFGADFEGRALPDSTKSSPLKGYEVLKPIPMKEGPAIPWFGKKGGGTQWELSMSIHDLIAGGYIREITAPTLESMSTPKGETTTTTTNGNGENTTTPKTNGEGDGSKLNMETGNSGKTEVTTPKDRVESSGNRPDAFKSLRSDADVPEVYRNDPRFNDLAADTAHMGKDGKGTVSPASRGEAMAGLKAESMKLVPGPIERGPAEIEFYDGNGNPWDVKAPPSPKPGAPWKFDAAEAGSSIQKQLASKGNPPGTFPNKNTGEPVPTKIILDSTYMTPADHAALWSWLNSNLTAEQLGRIVEVNTL